MMEIRNMCLFLAQWTVWLRTGIKKIIESYISSKILFKKHVYFRKNVVEQLQPQLINTCFPKNFY